MASKNNKNQHFINKRVEIHVILLKVSLLKVIIYVYNKALQKSHVKVKKAMQIQNQIKYK